MSLHKAMVIFFKPQVESLPRSAIQELLCTNPLMGMLKPQRNRQYVDWYTGRWWVGCYIRYSDDRHGRAAAIHQRL